MTYQQLFRKLTGRKAHNNIQLPANEPNQISHTPEDLPHNALYITGYEAKMPPGPNNQLPRQLIMTDQPQKGKAIRAFILFDDEQTKRQVLRSKCEKGQIIVGAETFEVFVQHSSESKDKGNQARMKSSKSKPARPSDTGKSQDRHSSIRTVAASPPLNPDGTPRLHLRGGCMGLMKRKEKFADDEVVPAVLWWLSGGNKCGDRGRPTGKRMREWKQKSRGDWDEGRERGFHQECVFVMSRGKYCRDQPRKKVEEAPPENPPSIGPSSSAHTSMMTGQQYGPYD